MTEFKSKIAELLTNNGVEATEDFIEVPPDSKMGDYSFPCFLLSKKEKKSPAEIAKGLSKKIDLHKYGHIIERIEAKGPYINFFINKTKFAEKVLREIYSQKENYGSTGIGSGKRVLVEHTSINPNASPHVGRARNSLLGDSIARIFRFQGYKVEVHYLVNDVGKQIAMLVLGCQNKEKNKENITFDDLLQLYVDFNKSLKENPALEKDVFEILNKLEKGDAEVKRKFREIVDICINGQAKILSEIGIKYDYYDYESKYLWNKKSDEALKKLEKTGKVFTDDEGRKVLNQEGYNLAMKSPVLVLTRADGTSLYPLRDLAYTIEKCDKNQERNVVVLGEDHKLYFQQIAAALSLLNYKAPEVVHYSFILLKEGKMSTRKGNVVLLEDFMKEARKKAAEEVRKREKSKDIEKTSRIVGYGALKFAILKISPDKNVVFDWKTALSFEGESGPYVQYSHARAYSIIRKYDKEFDADVDFSLLKHELEIELVKHLSKFEEKVAYTTCNLRPHIIAVFAHDLAKKFSEFYHACQCISDDEELSKARILLTECTRIVLKTSIGLLGIEAPEEM